MYCRSDDAHFQDKMACAVGDSCPEDDLAIILEFIEADMLDEDDEFNEEINTLLSEQSAVTYSCEICTKVCKSKQGLSRHRNMKHTEIPSLPTKTKVAEDMLHPLYFKQYVNDAAKKLAEGGCYSKKTLSALKGYHLDDANFSYQFVWKVIENFNGNGEKFYPQFYDCVSGDEIIFRGLNKRCSVILGLEVANAVLAHLTGSFASDTLCSVDIQELDGKERNIVKYLSGYVYHTLFRRLKKLNTIMSQVPFI